MISDYWKALRSRSTVLQDDEIKEKRNKCEGKIFKEKTRRIKKMFETKLNGDIIIKAFSTWARPMLKYSAPCLQVHVKKKIITMIVIINIFIDTFALADIILTLYEKSEPDQRGKGSLGHSLSFNFLTPFSNPLLFLTKLIFCHSLILVVIFLQCCYYYYYYY